MSSVSSECHPPCDDRLPHSGFCAAPAQLVFSPPRPRTSEHTMLSVFGKRNACRPSVPRSCQPPTQGLASDEAYSPALLRPKGFTVCYRWSDISIQLQKGFKNHSLRGGDLIVQQPGPEPCPEDSAPCRRPLGENPASRPPYDHTTLSQLRSDWCKNLQLYQKLICNVHDDVCLEC
jgi:hypothetical protein